MNKHPLLSKTLVIGLLMLMLSIPLMMVLNVVQERATYRDSAAQEVASAHAGPQIVSGPVLYWPYTETFTRTELTSNTDTPGKTSEVRVTEKHVYIGFPTHMETRSKLDTETRMRGLFPVTVYTSHHETRGAFNVEEIQPKTKNGQIALGQPMLLIGVSDLRGLLGAPKGQLGGHDLTVRQAPADAPLPLAASLDPATLQPGRAQPFTLSFDLAGTGRIGWVPLADENLVHLESTWQHPSFGGHFLPRTRTVNATGFQAHWQIPSLSTQAQQRFLQSGTKEREQDMFSVSLEDPVDVYRLSERATKYGLMFILLTFSAFFILEMVRRWRMHPMQYLMIGAALVLFFLLLLSISEHLPFAQAYAIASTACIGLLSHYLRHVLGGWRPGLGISAMLVALYGVLYSILVSEDHALMMGSLLLFGVLAAMMIATRRLDWYNVLKSSEADTAPAAE